MKLPGSSRARYFRKRRLSRRQSVIRPCSSGGSLTLHSRANSLCRAARGYLRTWHMLGAGSHISAADGTVFMMRRMPARAAEPLAKKGGDVLLEGCRGSPRRSFSALRDRVVIALFAKANGFAFMALGIGEHPPVSPLSVHTGMGS